MKGFNKKIITVITVLLTSTFLLGGCGGGKDKENQTDTNPSADQSADNTEETADITKFKVGMECAYAPFNWTQSDDSNGAVPIGDGTFANGYDVQIAKKVAEGLNKELQIVKTEWDGLPPALTSGKIDAVVAGMSATADRKKVIDFTDNYYTSDLVVVVRKDSNYANAKTLDGLKGAKITGQLNTFHYSVIDQIPDVVKEIAMPDFTTMIVSLGSKKIDGYVSERPGALSAVESNPDLTFVEFGEGGGFDYETDESSIAIGLTKESHYLEPINNILKTISEEERQQIMSDAIKNQPVIQ